MIKDFNTFFYANESSAFGLVGGKPLDLLCSSRDNLKHVKPDSLRERSTLSDDNSVTFLATESWGEVG